MYEFVTGPLALISISVFVIGMTVHVVRYLQGLDWQLDRITYKKHVSFGARGAVRSIMFWILPYGTRSWRNNPFFTFFVFIFHAGLLIIPFFLQAHNILLESKLGFSLFSISDSFAYILTLGTLVSVLFLVLRRLSIEHVRSISSFNDYALLLICAAPFITGLLCYHQAPDYRFWLIAHVISGEIMLIAIPFTKLSHFVLFFLSRAQIGIDFGIKRGGMKNDMPW